MNGKKKIRKIPFADLIDRRVSDFSSVRGSERSFVGSLLVSIFATLSDEKVSNFRISKFNFFIQ